MIPSRNDSSGKMISFTLEIVFVVVSIYFLNEANFKKYIYDDIIFGALSTRG